MPTMEVGLAGEPPFSGAKSGKRAGFTVVSAGSLDLRLRKEAPVDSASGFFGVFSGDFCVI